MKKIFNNDKLFYAAPWVLCLSYIVTVGIYVTFGWENGYSYLALAAFNFVIVLLIVGSYKKHEKNMMKGLVGGLITLIAYRALSTFLDLFSYEGVHLLEYLFAFVSLIFALMLFINHFKLSSDHKSSPSTMKKSQIICILFIVVDIIWYIFDIITYGEGIYVQYTILCISYIIAVICRLYVIIAVETRLDLFKIEREKKQELNEEDLNEVDGGYGGATYVIKCKTCGWQSKQFYTLSDAYKIKKCEKCESEDIECDAVPKYIRKK